MTPLTDLLTRLEGATEWRPVPGWPYEASDTGVLRSAITRKPLKPTLSDRGYERVTFQHNKVRRDVRVHRAIYEAFNGPIPPGHQINHLDGRKENNRPDNLEACLPIENEAHAVAHGLKAAGERNGAHTQPARRPRGSRTGNAVLTEADIPAIRAMCTTLAQAEVARRFSISESTVSLIMRGRIWTHV